MLAIVGILSGWLVLVAPTAPNPPGSSIAAASPDRPVSACAVTSLKTGDAIASDPKTQDPAASGPKAGGPTPEISSSREQNSGARDRVTYRHRRDLAITLATGTTWIVTEIEKKHLAPSECRWCDETLNGFDAWGRDHLRWESTRSAARLSSLTGFVVAPALAYGLDWAAARHDDRGSNIRDDAVLITQSVTIAADVSQLLKFTTGRQRPYLRPPFPSELSTLTPADNNTSFPSGHATLAFSAVTSGAEIAALRGYRWAPWIWKAGVPVAILTAYFRVAADRHYLTDVLAGAGVGSAIGFAVPYFGHRRGDPRIPSVAVVPTVFGSRMVAAEWVW